ncbi:MAG: hypothetical protein MMC33_004531 [Icmadophila ericetorum]|nr:hypothetical protein [Icmadophila ericetorum]
MAETLDIGPLLALIENLHGDESFSTLTRGSSAMLVWLVYRRSLTVRFFTKELAKTEPKTKKHTKLWQNSANTKLKYGNGKSRHIWIIYKKNSEYKPSISASVIQVTGAPKSSIPINKENLRGHVLLRFRRAIGTKYELQRKMNKIKQAVYDQENKENIEHNIFVSYATQNRPATNLHNSSPLLLGNPVLIPGNGGGRPPTRPRPTSPQPIRRNPLTKVPNAEGRPSTRPRPIGPQSVKRKLPIEFGGPTRPRPPPGPQPIPPTRPPPTGSQPSTSRKQGVRTDVPNGRTEDGTRPRPIGPIPVPVKPVPVPET